MFGAVLFEAWSLRAIGCAVYSKTPSPGCWLDLFFFGRNDSRRLDEIKLWIILFQERIAFHLDLLLGFAGIAAILVIQRFDNIHALRYFAKRRESIFIQPRVIPKIDKNLR
jgi:hypothetical protein